MPTALPVQWTPGQFTADFDAFDSVPVNLITALDNPTFQEVDPGAALMYLLRRFGPSVTGTDPDKDICQYALNTPDPSVILIVGIQLQLSFGVYLSGQTLRDAANPHSNLPKKTRQRDLERVNSALHTALLDLLTPTRVQSTRLNLLGHAQELQDQEGAEPYAGAGYGVPMNWFRSPEDHFNAEATPI